MFGLNLGLEASLSLLFATLIFSERSNRVKVDARHVFLEVIEVGGFALFSNDPCAVVVFGGLFDVDPIEVQVPPRRYLTGFLLGEHLVLLDAQLLLGLGRLHCSPFLLFVLLILDQEWLL